jgi:hypothetical protein
MRVPEMSITTFTHVGETEFSEVAALYPIRASKNLPYGPCAAHYEAVDSDGYRIGMGV